LRAVNVVNIFNAARNFDEAHGDVGGVVAICVVNEVIQVVDVIDVVASASKEGIFVFGTSVSRHKLLDECAIGEFNSNKENCRIYWLNLTAKYHHANQNDHHRIRPG
jgi:hypothetical protein